MSTETFCYSFKWSFCFSSLPHSVNSTFLQHYIFPRWTIVFLQKCTIQVSLYYTVATDQLWSVKWLIQCTRPSAGAPGHLLQVPFTYNIALTSPCKKTPTFTLGWEKNLTECSSLIKSYTDGLCPLYPAFCLLSVKCLSLLLSVIQINLSLHIILPRGKWDVSAESKNIISGPVLWQINWIIFAFSLD